MTILGQRNAFEDHAATPSTLRAERGPADAAPPLVTIAIPTFRRASELMEAIASAEAQQGDIRFEILVLDNDPDPAAGEAIVARLPAHPRVPLRYYANAENLGMFGNWNRCIELARGKWVTLLNDDDLLRPDYLRRIMAVIARRPEIDGIVCRKEFYYRAGKREPRTQSWKQKLWQRAKRLRFDKDGIARITPRNLFFGVDIGNGLGFLFKREVAVALGGYYPEDFPTADGYFYLRFCIDRNLFWTHEVLADIGVGDNESMNVETVYTSVRKQSAMRSAMIGRYVPRSWKRYLPQLVANAMLDSSRLWNVDLDRTRLERELDMRIPEPSYRRVTLLRLLHRAA